MTIMVAHLASITPKDEKIHCEHLANYKFREIIVPKQDYSHFLASFRISKITLSFYN
jgi:hypothetical protein